MKTGAQVIVQATLDSGDWRGGTDVLLRVKEPSRLGNWSYEVVDCKLARETKAHLRLDHAVSAHSSRFVAARKAFSETSGCAVTGFCAL